MHPLPARAGWAVVVVDSRGNVHGAQHGPVRFPWAFSGSRELWAAIFALIFKGPEPITIIAYLPRAQEGLGARCRMGRHH